jgi:hypothetical protein
MYPILLPMLYTCVPDPCYMSCIHFMIDVYSPFIKTNLKFYGKHVHTRYVSFQTFRFLDHF